MTTNRRPMDPDNAEHLLRHASAGRLHGRDPLVRLLRAAAAPASANELTHEREAMAAFRLKARRPVAASPPRRSMIRSALTKMLTLKAALVLAAVSAGGVALAASTGVLPNPLERLSPGGPAPAHPDRPSGGAGGTSGTPSPSIIGLCHALLADAGADHGKALEDPAFTVLITTAGGKDKVDAYCTRVMTGAEPTAHPAGGPTTHPASGPTTHPTGEPSTHPAGEPSTHPSGPPTTHGAG